MKRDMTLVRKILLWAIDQPHGNIGANPAFEDYDEEQVGYHVFLMHEAGLVHAALRDLIGLPSPGGQLLRVTWEGYEFASAARDEALWRKAGTTILKEGASFSFGLLKRWLESQAAGSLGLP